MSATNRGSERIKNDNYPTPAWCVKRLLEVWQPKNGLLLEPCVGDCIIISAIDKYLSHNHNWISYDIRTNTYTPTPNSYHFVQDFLIVDTLPTDLLKSCPSCSPISAVITNPPFSLLNEFLYHSRKLCPEADLVYLLRLNTLAGGPTSGRDRLYQDLGTPNIYVLPNRPSFVKGKTDACEYAWFVFPPQARSEGIVRILNQTPKKERT